MGDGVNFFYAREEDRAWLPLLATPANVTDDWIPFALEQARQRSAEWDSWGPFIRGLARRLHGLKTRYPRLSRATRALLRRVVARE
jgi:hypothetical protein